MTVEQIRISVSKSLTEGNGWPPSLPEFIARGTEAIDYDAAYFRCLNQKPEGRVEKWVYEKAYYNIRTQGDKEARKDHKRFMKQAEELEKRGELTLPEEELIGLPVHSVKNLNDRKREEWEQSHGKELNPRIKKILEGKK